LFLIISLIILAKVNHTHDSPRYFQRTSQLSLSEQIYLATQLLQLVEKQVTPLPYSETSKPDGDRGSISYLMANPISVNNFKPLTRQEIYDRSESVALNP
jgi:hypothetical protein